MKEAQRIVEGIIDVLAIGIVIESFLRFVGVSTLHVMTVKWMDWLIIILLLMDLVYRGRQSSDMKKFVNDSWLEAVCLLPFVPFFRLFRVFRIIKKSKLRKLGRFVHGMLMTNALYHVIIVVMLLAVIGGGVLYRVEQGNIASF